MPMEALMSYTKKYLSKVNFKSIHNRGKGSDGAYLTFNPTSPATMLDVGCRKPQFLVLMFGVAYIT